MVGFLLATLAFASAGTQDPLIEPSYPLPPTPIEAPTEELLEPGDIQVVEGKWILVDLKTQRIQAYEDGEVVYDFPCSTGRKGMGTPKGDWPIRRKARYNRALPEYGSTPIPYSLGLNIKLPSGRRPSIAIHQYKSVPKYPASHGCIRVKPGDAAKLFHWAEVGVVVTVR